MTTAINTAAVHALIKGAQEAQEASKAAIKAAHTVDLGHMLINRNDKDGRMFTEALVDVDTIRNPHRAKMAGSIDAVFQKYSDEVTVMIGRYFDQSKALDKKRQDRAALRKRPAEIKALKKEIAKAMEVIDEIHCGNLKAALRGLFVEEAAIPAQLKDLEAKIEAGKKALTGEYHKCKSFINKLRDEQWFVLFEEPEAVQAFARMEEANAAARAFRAQKEAEQLAKRKADAEHQAEVANVLGSVKAPKIGANITVKKAA